MTENFSISEIKKLLEELEWEKYSYEQLEKSNTDEALINYFEGKKHGLDVAISTIKKYAQIK